MHYLPRSSTTTPSLNTKHTIHERMYENPQISHSYNVAAPLPALKYRPTCKPQYVSL